MGVETLIFAGIAAFQAFAGTAIGGFLVKTAVGVGLSLAVGAFSQKKIKQAGQSVATGVQLEMATGADTPRSVALGHAATRGHLVWFKETAQSTPGDRLHMHIVYSDGWCDPPTAVIVDGVEKALIEQPVTGTEHARFHIADFGPDIIVRWHDGRPGQQADSDMVAVSAGEITVDDVGEGMAYLSLTIVISRDGITSAPEFLWVGGQYRCYDLRQDSTVGGAGAHRLDDPATWGSSVDPFIHFYNYAVGIRAGSDTRALGGFADVDGLIPSTFMVASNVADEGVITDGVTEPRYACCAILAADGEDHRGKVAGLLQAGAGWAVERGGQLGVLAGAAQTPVVTFTDDDVLWDEEVRWSRGRERDERVNQVRGQFVSPAALYQPDDYPVVTNAAALVEDGELLEATLDLQTVPSPTQAQRIGDIRLHESRLGEASVPLPDAFLALELGDWVRWNSARYGDYLYRIYNHEDRDTGFIRLELQRRNNAVYGGPSFSTYTPPPTPALPAAAPSTVSGFDLQIDVIEGESGGIPALVALWTPPNDARVDAVVIRYRQIGSLAWQYAPPADPEEGRTTISGLASSADYEAQATINTTPSRTTTWGEPKSVKTADPPIVIPKDSVSWSATRADIQGLLASIRRELSSLTQIVAADALSGGLAEIKSYTENGEIRALISKVDEDTRALVATETTALATTVEAIASQAVLVEAALGGNTATGLMKIEAAVTPDGLTNSFGFLGEIAGSDGEYASAGWRTEIISDGQNPANTRSQTVFKSDAFKIDDGNDGTAPFVFESGNLVLDVAYINTIRSGRLESLPGNSNGYVLLDLDDIVFEMIGPA